MGIALTALLCAACSSLPQGVPLRGQLYVALGSSFAAGPGLPPMTAGAPPRCTRSLTNYPNLLAARLGLRLVDATCSGATTAYVLDRWKELPAQMDSVTADTRLVTITIGGNDVGYIGNLIGAACTAAAAKAGEGVRPACWPPKSVDEDDWQRLEQQLVVIAQEVRRRAPKARLLFVQYVPVLPDGAGCDALSLSTAQQQAARVVASRLYDATARAAVAGGAEVVAAATQGADHSACGAIPWATGYFRDGDPKVVPFHPTAAGMSAVADALARRLAAGLN